VLARLPLHGACALVLFAACKASPPPAVGGPNADPAPAEARPPSAGIELHFEDSGRSVTLAPGAPLVIKLHAPAGTGFGWDLTKGDSTVLALAAPKTTESAEAGPGRRQLEVFSFVAKGAGTTHVELTFHRPWEHEPPARTFTADITVR